MILLAASTAAAPSYTVTTQASGGALREWRRGRPGVLFVCHRTEHWFHVTLTDPCPTDLPLETLSHTTDTNGTFDRFSRLRFRRLPNVVCGVRAIAAVKGPPAG